MSNSAQTPAPASAEDDREIPVAEDGPKNEPRYQPENPARRHTALLPYDEEVQRIRADYAQRARDPQRHTALLPYDEEVKRRGKLTDEQARLLAWEEYEQARADRSDDIAAGVFRGVVGAAAAVWFWFVFKRTDFLSDLWRLLRGTP